MRSFLTLLSIGILLLAGCRSARRAPARPARPTAAPVVAAPAPSGPTRLRYYDVKDFPIRNGILIVRATQPELNALDEHLSGMRRILRDAKPVEVARPLTPVQEKAPRLVVQIHAVHDIVTARPALDILQTIRAGLGDGGAQDVELRMQGTSALVVKAPRTAHERVAEILEQVRAELKADAAR